MSTFLRADLGAIAGLMIWTGFWISLYFAIKREDIEEFDIDSAALLATFGIILLVAAICFLPIALLLN